MNQELLSWVALMADVTAKAMIVLTAAWLFARLARRASAAARHMIWMIALATVLLVPVFEAVAPRLTLLTIPAAAVAPDPTPNVAEAPLNAEATVPSDAWIVPSPVPGPPSSVNLAIWVGGVWAGGCVVVFLSALLGWISLNRIKARTLPLPASFHPSDGGCRIRLKLSREGRPPSALTWGALRPTILLPRSAEEWPKERLDTVLLHELEHVRRRDAAMQLLGVAACALYWFNPAVWLAAKAARCEAEAATDDAVLRRGVRPSAYANTLMEVAAEIGRRPHLISPTGVAFMKKSKIEARLRAILDGRARRGVTRTEKMVAAVVAVAILLPLAFVRAAAVAPFAALPESSEPTVTVQVTPMHAAHKKLTKKQLAARRAHLRAVAAAELHAAIDLEIAARRKRLEQPTAAFAGLTQEQVKQAAAAGQLHPEIAVASRGGQPTNLRRVRSEKDAASADLLEARATLAKLNQRSSADTAVRVANARVDAAQAILQVTHAREKELNARFQPHAQVEQERAALEQAVKGLNSRSNFASARQAEATLRTLEAERAILATQSSAQDAARQKLDAAVAKLAAQKGAAGADQAVVRKKIEAILAEEKGARNASRDAVRKQIETMVAAEKGARNASKDGVRARLEAALAAQKGARNASLDGLHRKLEAERAMIAAERSARNASQDGLRRMLEAERAMIEAERGARIASREAVRRQLEAERAALLRARRVLRDANHQPLPNSQMRRGYGADYAKLRKAELERERAELRARLKAIDAELGKKGR